MKAGATNSEDNIMHAANQANVEEEEPEICAVCETVIPKILQKMTRPQEIRHSSVKASAGHSFTGSVLDYRKQPTL